MHVNLMLESERRSASPVSLQMTIRIILGTLAAVFLMVLISVFSTHRALKNSVRYNEDEWVRTEPKYKAALQLRDDLARKTATLKEIQSWRESRIAWGRQLEYLQEVVPSAIQLTELRVTHDLLVMTNNVPARVFEMRLSGRTGALRSEADVSEFRQALSGQPPFDKFMEAVSIPPGAFRQDPATKSDRVFEITCK
ncbi:MAG: hypothetical protein ACOYM3_31300 [Terrimicrobiaceae bacterium]